MNPADASAFQAAYVMGLPSADWNMDGGLAPNSCVINTADIDAFNLSYAIGCCGP